jgi:uncharacterized protein with HEPN domain
MSRDVHLYVDDILTAIAAIETYTAGIGIQDFVATPVVRDAVIRQLEIIGEAVGHLPQPILDQYPDIPWRRIVGLRNRLIHGYFGVILERVWAVIEQDLPALRVTMQEIQERLS